MGVRGPRKKAASQQARRGDPGKRKKATKKKAAAKKPPAKKKATRKKATRKKTATRKAPTPSPSTADDPPDWLGPEARVKWRQVLPTFQRRRLVTELDYDALAIYCDAWQQLAEADQDIGRHGEYHETDKGGFVQHPAVWKRNKAIDRIRKVGEQLGLTPNSRRGLELDDEAEDPLQEFLD